MPACTDTQSSPALPPQALPAGVFADPYELAGLEEAGRARWPGLGSGSGARARVFGAVDLEALEPAASPTLLALLSPAQARPSTCPPRKWRLVQLLWAPGSGAGAALLALHRCTAPPALCGGLLGKRPMPRLRTGGPGRHAGRCRASPREWGRLGCAARTCYCLCSRPAVGSAKAPV